MTEWHLDEDEVTVLVEGAKLVRRLRWQGAPTPSGNFGPGQQYDLSFDQIDSLIDRLETATDIVLQEEDGDE